MKYAAVFCVLLLSCFLSFCQPRPSHNLRFSQLATRWDEAMPVGNGMLGALIWQKDGLLRLSLDRADLWDERPALDISRHNFQWVEERVRNKDYEPVHAWGDRPYDTSANPTKLPAAALGFNIQLLGNVVSNELDIQTGLNRIVFGSGAVFNCYIHARRNQGYFGFEKLPMSVPHVLETVIPQLVVHDYGHAQTPAKGLQRLGYPPGSVYPSANSVRYHQPTWGGHYFEVLITWKQYAADHIIGSWTISNDRPAQLPLPLKDVKEPTGWQEHMNWWKRFWSRSSLSLPDSALEKQYYLDIYKLGCVARMDAPAITLQAVWTADNGDLPPWKGDFHNDLNTQLSYWPAYTANRLEEAGGYTNWLWKIRDRSKAYTKQYFGVDGLNVGGVVTLNGHPMGGWIQYALSPTVSAWCAQHFYWQWKYSQDDEFLRNRAYPYLHDAATYLEDITRLENGVRKLPLSSSPEYNDNRIDAWFTNWTNFDLSLARFLFQAAAELAEKTGKRQEAEHWRKIAAQLPGFDVDSTGLTVAPGQELLASHRHMSPYMAIYPLALLDINQPEDKDAIENSLHQVQKNGTAAWCGYSFCWMACLYARAYQADSAVRQLQVFASNFCSPNSFHLNGDQKGGQYSHYTYRPFTLEGNFAFAQGVQELLLQSRKDYLQVFPAVPGSWKAVSFKNLRGEGAFLVSASIENNVPVSVKVVAEQGGLLRIKLPFKTWLLENMQRSAVAVGDNGILSVRLQKGQAVIFENAHE